MKSKAMKPTNRAATDLAQERNQWRKVIYALLALTVVTTSLPSHVFAQQNEDLDRLFDDEELDEPKGNFSAPNGQVPPAGPGAPAADPSRGAAAPPDATSPDFGNPPPSGKVKNMRAAP